MDSKRKGPERRIPERPPTSERSDSKEISLDELGERRQFQSSLRYPWERGGEGMPELVDGRLEVMPAESVEFNIRITTDENTKAEDRRTFLEVSQVGQETNWEFEFKGGSSGSHIDATEGFVRKFSRFVPPMMMALFRAHYWKNSDKRRHVRDSLVLEIGELFSGILFPSNLITEERIKTAAGEEVRRRITNRGRPRGIGELDFEKKLKAAFKKTKGFGGETQLYIAGKMDLSLDQLRSKLRSAKLKWSDVKKRYGKKKKRSK
jgi:hypothetical protein